MTTYTLNGFTTYYDNDIDADVGLKSSTTLQLTVPDSETSLSYSVLPLAPGDSAPDDLYVDVDLDLYNVRVDDGLFQGSDNDPDTSIFQLNWTDSGNVARVSTILILEERDANVPPFGTVDSQHIFLLGGDALPTFNSLAEFNDFLNNDLDVFDIPPASSPFGPDKDIALSSLSGSSTENDLIIGDDGDNEFDGGAGNDTILGLDGSDTLLGGDGNDSLNPGTNDDGYDEIVPGAGQDTVDFSDVDSTTSVGLGQWDLDAGVTVTINGQTNTASVDKGVNGTTQIINVGNTFTWGLSVFGSSHNDIFNITPVNDEDTFLGVTGREGDDTFNFFAGDGFVRLNYRQSDVTSGVNVNLNTGLVSNDGYGDQDTINGVENLSELRTTMLDDSVLGSDGRDRVILMAGNDTADGGDGFDLIRYDRSQVEAVNVNLQTGTATGTWRGEAFNHQLSNFEEVRGSRDGNDTIIGNDAVGEYIEGRGGDDSINGGGGDDDLRGEEGNDTLLGGDGRDSLRGGDGNDRLDASGGTAESQGWGDYVRPGLGTDTVLGHADLFADGEGIDISYGDLSGINGLTLTVSGNGTGTAVSGDGRVNDTFTFTHYFEGSQDGDVMTGSDEDHWEGWVGLGGADTIDGRGGYDSLDYSYEADYFDGSGSGIDADLAAGTIIDTQGSTDEVSNIEEVRGSQFNDMLDGSGLTTDIEFQGNDGNDTLLGGSGSDRLVGGDGDDSLNPGSNVEGYDAIIAGAGNDTIDLSDLGPGAGVGLEHWDLDAGITLTVNGNTNSASVDKGVNGITQIINISNAINYWGLNVEGSSHDDTINVTSGNDDDSFIGVFGGDGDDTFNFNGGAGHIRLNYRSSDILNGVNVNLATGITSNDGYGGQDTINGVANITSLRTTMLDDNVIGSAGNDQIILMAGNDTADGGDGFDLLRYDRNQVEAVNVNLQTGTATGTWRGEAFNHTISNFEEVRGSREGNDTIIGNNAANEQIDGRGGDDSIRGGGGNDTLIGGDGQDILRGNAGNDSLYGDDGNDALWGDAGADTVWAGTGNDQIGGADGADRLWGEDGNDTIWGGKGNDQMGGANDDDRLWGGAGNDTIWGGNGADQIGGGNDHDQLWGGAGVDTIWGGNGGDRINGGTGNDALWGDSGNDRIEGGEGNDVIGAGIGNDIAFGNAGDDTIYGGGGNDNLSGGADQDLIDGGAGADTVFAGDGADVLIGVAGDDELWGGNGNDTAYGGSDNDVVLGLGGQDELWGGIGADTLDGGAGNDTLRGGPDTDADVFVFSEGTDIAFEFGAGDVVDLSGVAGITDFADLQASHLSGAVNAVIDDGEGNTLTLIGVNSATLDASDFLFG